MAREILTKSAKQTQKLGEGLAYRLKGGEIIGLIGELGSGKTTFVQGLAKGLGIKKRVLSPTFIFVRPYNLFPIPYTLFHIDLYRIKTSEDAKDLGLEEIWSDPKNIVVIEWAEKIKDILPEKTIKIYFEYLGEKKRRIIISNF